MFIVFNLGVVNLMLAFFSAIFSNRTRKRNKDFHRNSFLGIVIVGTIIEVIHGHEMLHGRLVCFKTTASVANIHSVLQCLGV